MQIVCKFDMSTPTIKVILDTRRALKPEREGMELTYPVKLRVTYHRRQKYFDVDVEPLSRSNWERIANGQRLSRTLLEQRREIREAEARAMAIAKRMDPFNFHGFDIIWRAGSVPAIDNSLQAIFTKYIEDLKKENRISTASSYQCALNSLMSFNKTLQWNDISPALLQDYESYMVSEGKSQNTTGIYLRSLRSIINHGISKGAFLKEHYPFGRKAHGKYQIPSSQNKKRALSKAEVSKIKQLSPKPGSRMELARDFWLFSYYANGCNIKDIAYLKWKNIDWDEGVIQFVRKKTERANKSNQIQITAIINDHITDVIARRGADERVPEGFVFNLIDSSKSAEANHLIIQDFVRRVNIGLKQIAKAVGIEKNLTTYTARHSHAYALLMGGASLEIIMDQFKHSSMQTTMNYIDSIDNEKRKEVAMLL